MREKRVLLLAVFLIGIFTVLSQPVRATSDNLGKVKYSDIVDNVMDNVVFQTSDPRGDDYGPGHYIYPKADIFGPNTHDLLTFTVGETENDAVFTFEFENLGYLNAWNLPTKFGPQQIYVCIDQDREWGEEATETLLNVKVHPAQAWENMLAIGNSYGAFQNTIYRPGMTRVSQGGRTNGLALKIYSIDNTIIAKASKDLIGEPKQKWAYTVLLWSEDVGNIRGIDPGENATRMWNACGADPEAYRAGVHPLVWDMLVPPGTTQENVLTSYSVENEEYATVYAVGPGIDSVPSAPTLSVETSPVSGYVMVNGENWGVAPVKKQILPGEYKISFGKVQGYTVPENKVVRLETGGSKQVTGEYEKVKASQGLPVLIIGVIVGVIVVLGGIVWKKR